MRDRVARSAALRAAVVMSTTVDLFRDATGSSAWPDDLGRGRTRLLGRLRTALRAYLAEITQPRRRVIDDALHADPLGALLGPTRADIPRSLPAGGTTTGPATRNNITPATASHHTTVLRIAGLITTRRDTNRAVHTLTPLGLRLLGRT
ncbi:ArsR/SmtB family transcription factor [Saccharothrix lopnurensis]|uniref:ArsR/SmtB family transcription factor n=1 Tax=Saccharothrix lopnurensis TaxID=1670621 RepID=A0ABW1P862_9PSEU